MKLLIIEDDANFAYLVARALDGLTESVVVAQSWEEAKPHLAERQMAWIDLRLPPTTHEEESVANIRALRMERPELVIIVGSGYITPELRARLDRAGVDAAFYKDASFSAEQVASIIIVALMRANLRGHVENKFLLQRALEWMHERHPAIA